MTEQSTYTVRKYKDGDEIEINRLFNEILCKDRHRTLDEWRWKMKENPAKVKDIANYITVVEADGKVIGQYANWPVDFKYKDEIVKVGHPIENFIHPDYRLSFDVQLDMFNRQYEATSEEDVSFGFGFPNQVAYLIGKRFLGYKDIGELATLSTRLSFLFPVKRRFPFLPKVLFSLIQQMSEYFYKIKINLTKRQSDISVEEVVEFNSEYDELWNKVKDYYPLLAVRDGVYMNWRYLKKPTREYKIFFARKGAEIKGCIVLKIIDDSTYFWGARVGLIMELLCLKDAGIPVELLKTALNYFVSGGVDFSVAVLLKDDILLNGFLNAGFAIRDDIYKHRMVYKIYNERGIDENVLKDSRNWHVMFGDFDPL